MEYNSAQSTAINHEGSPLMIEAGAGTGKTTTIVGRVLKFIKEGVSPRKIWMLTFTNKAARSMRAKLAQADPMSDSVFVGTMHYASLRMLYRIFARKGIEANCRVLGQDESKVFWKKAYEEVFSAEELDELKRNRLGGSATGQALLSRMVCGKMDMPELCETIPQAALFDRLFGEGTLERVFSVYAKMKEDNAYLDFDDILAKFDRLLDDDANVAFVRRFCTHIFVDEYQDTSVLQASILKKIIGRSPNITVVGDSQQSIYSFLSANVGNMLQFARDFPGAQTVRLTDNYRSTQRILDMSNLILKGSETEAAALVSVRAEDPGLPKPEICAYKNFYREAAGIVRRVGMWLEEGVPHSQIAVLARFSLVHMLLEQEMMKAGIPYVKYGGTPLFKRRSMQVFLALLDLSFNRYDYIAWEKILRLGAFIGENLSVRAVEDMKSDVMWDWRIMPEFSLGKGKRAEALREIWQILEPMGTLSGSDREDTSGYLETVYGVFSKLYSYHFANMGTLKGGGAKKEEVYGDEELKNDLLQVREFVGNLACVDREELRAAAENFRMDNISASLNDSEEKVVLSTIHSAKGLEWEKVVLMGMENGILPPFEREYGSDDNCAVEPVYMDEEKRLFYVAATRAKDELLITYSGMRMKHASSRSVFLNRFMQSCPAVRVTHDEAREFGPPVEALW